MPLIIMGVALVAITFWAASSFGASAQAAPDADNGGMMTSDLTSFTNENQWYPISGLSGSMHKAEWKDLVIDVSLECGLMTDTLVKSKGGNKDTSTAMGSVEVQVLVGGMAAEPGSVTFCKREQKLNATFQGLIQYEDENGDTVTCLITDIDGNVTIDEDCLEPESVQLILGTVNANAFNFVYRDLPSGNYDVVVEARINTGTTAQEGSANAAAYIGKGSAIVDEVRFAKTTN